MNPKIMPTITEWLTIYKTDYCTSFTWDTCVEWTSIQSMSIQDVKEIWVEIGWIIVVFLIIINLVLFFLKYILRAMFPQRSRF